jgi:cobalt-zinc-cadmium efflux system outer membrane protein
VEDGLMRGTNLGFILSLAFASAVWANSPEPVAQSADVLTPNWSSLQSRLQAQYAEPALWQQRQALLAERHQQLGKRANPSLELDVTDWRSGQREQSIMLSQPLDLWRQRQAAQQVIAVLQGGESVAQQRDLAELNVLLQAQYAALLVANQRAALARQTAQLQQDAYTAAQTRFQAGRLAAVDVQRMALADAQAQAAQQRAEFEQQQTAQQWLELWQSQPDAPTLERVQRWSMQPPPALPADLADKWMPFWQAEAQLQAQQLQASQSQLARQARGNPSVRVGMQQVEAEEKRQTQVLLGLSIPLNVFQHNQPQQQAIAQQRQWQQHAEQRQQQQRLALLARYQAEDQRRRAELATLSHQALPIAEQLRQRMWLGFAAGKFALIEAQQAQQEVLHIQQSIATAEQALWQNQINAAALQVGWLTDQLAVDNPVALLQTWHTWQQQRWSTSQSLINQSHNIDSLGAQP